MTFFFGQQGTHKDTFSLTADGNTTPIRWRGGKGSFAAQGTFGGGTVLLQASFDGGSVFLEADGADTDATFTSNGVTNFEFPEGTLLRANLAGATAPTISIFINEII